ncbi:MAG: transposase zinc-binding domain-containing protein [Lewinellaceae bacterium]|nr:transposase zinc-binding domain-containing protein [Lewinellaceae bacterium]
MRTLSALERCRTAALGGHIDACTECGAVRISYNSCRNRHCPKCGGMRSANYGYSTRSEELLPVKYYHVVFTIPEQFNEWCLYNPAFAMTRFSKLPGKPCALLPLMTNGSALRQAPRWCSTLGGKPELTPTHTLYCTWWRDRATGAMAKP